MLAYMLTFCQMKFFAIKVKMSLHGVTMSLACPVFVWEIIPRILGKRPKGILV